MFLMIASISVAIMTIGSESPVLFCNIYWGNHSQQFEVNVFIF